jgi:hypothetical protein
VWWTQAPDDYPLLTGWLNGAQSKRLQKTDVSSLLQESLQSLSNIFKIKVSSLKQKLTAWHIEDWSKDRFTLGGYSYDTLQTDDAKKILNTPVEETIFFAGEALYKGAFTRHGRSSFGKRKRSCTKSYASVKFYLHLYAFPFSHILQTQCLQKSFPHP